MDNMKRLKIELVKGEFEKPIKGGLYDPAEVFQIFKDIKDGAKETCIGVYLNEIWEVNSYEIHSIGSARGTMVMPDEIFRNAILTNSKSFILVHNHPSGNAVPSVGDLEMMKVLRLQSEIMNRCFLDFIIVTDSGYWSMFEQDGGRDYRG